MHLDIYNGTRQKIPQALLRRAVDIFEKKMRIARGEVSLAFVGETRMRALNKHYRGRNRVTDVLSFSEGRRGGYLGELVICNQQVQRQARQQQTSVRVELLFIFMHGLLHLIGYDDATERGWREMEHIGACLCKSVR